MSVSTSRFVFTVLFVLNVLLWSRSRYGAVDRVFANAGSGSLVKRMALELSEGPSVGMLGDTECRPLAFPLQDQCRHVTEDCAPPDTVTDINYLIHYFCTSQEIRPFAFGGLVLWLIFLFSTLGISASDFFTPNLATIASLLGLDENVTGVTLLAFGNGSPDVFSTFSAMRAHSGSLAIGELVGAATFIVSCVVGSMCIIKPFQVNRGPFLRDVGFFAVAVAMIIVFLWDAQITVWEAGSLIIVYIIYVLFVVVGSYMQRRSERKRAALAEAMVRDPIDQPYTDEPLPRLSVPRAPTRGRAISAPNPPRLQIGNLPIKPNTRSPSPSTTHRGQLPSFSLVGALEFREVVASLSEQAAATSLGIFETPVTPYAGGHYHPHLRSSRTPRSSAAPSLRSSMDEETLTGLRLGNRSVSRGTSYRYPQSSLISPGEDEQTSDYFSSQGDLRTENLPVIFRTPASPTSTLEDESEQLYPPSKRKRWISVIRQTFHVLFPTLHHFGDQTVLGKIACLLAAPAVLALTVTLPVVVTPQDVKHDGLGKGYDDSPLVDLAEDGVEQIISAENRVEEMMHDLPFNKWLTAAQCVFGPLFCAKILFDDHKHETWILLGAAVAGFVAGLLVLGLTSTGTTYAARMTRCAMGFCIAVVWIMAIADEVVDVLKTLGLIFGLSDAIIGLTIFAVGNSLADLVANMSVASFAPIMGFSACFGGPMLNILLGVGVSGSVVIHQESAPYHLKLSNTLFVSCFGLLFLLAATLVFVPLNNYFLSRQWGILLISSYAIIMLINIIVEFRY